MSTCTQQNLQEFADAYEEACDRWSDAHQPHFLFAQRLVAQGELHINVLCIQCGDEWLLVAVPSEGGLEIQHWMPMLNVSTIHDTLAADALREVMR